MKEKKKKSYTYHSKTNTYALNIKLGECYKVITNMIDIVGDSFSKIYLSKILIEYVV